MLRTWACATNVRTMKRRPRRWVALGLVLVVVGLIAWRWNQRELPNVRRSDDPPPSRLDAKAFREQLAAVLQRAKQVAARRAPVVAEASPVPSPGSWARKGIGPAPGMTTMLITPQCILGPHEVCLLLADLVAGCDAGDALDCLAVGQFLADTPPRALIVITFFYQACRIGDPIGCERVEHLRAASDVSCEADPLACGWRAYKSGNRADHEEACSFGAAESCSYLSDQTTDLDESRAYLEMSCQLGMPTSCWALALKLSPKCHEDEAALGPCYPVDEAAAKTAREIACAAGWMEGEDCER